jgi:hypothetical protein
MAECETETPPTVLPWIRRSADGSHRRVIDLCLNGHIRVICLNCWHSWPEGGDCSAPCEPR